MVKLVEHLTSECSVPRSNPGGNTVSLLFFLPDLFGHNFFFASTTFFVTTLNSVLATFLVTPFSDTCTAQVSVSV